MQIRSTDALIVVDVQKDFCPDGALGVAEGDVVVPVINAVLPRFQHIAFTRDWHPADHCSFDDAPGYVDGSWPAHCVAGTTGAEFHEDLRVPDAAWVVSKGMDAGREAYSAFEGTNLAADLKVRRIEGIVICGLATDYCVKSTALDGAREGFSVVVLKDACRAVDNPPGSGDRAFADMERAGVLLSSSEDIA